MGRKGTWMKRFLFPAILIGIYGILLVFSPQKASTALRHSANIFLNLAGPLTLVFALMTAVNLFLDPARITRFLGKDAGLKGVAFSAAAGTISTGPIYAWYPLLGELRQKGARNSLLVIFLGNRAVKPLLLPVMVTYFGWLYVLVLTLFMVTGSVAAGYLVGYLVKE
jgi:uncharacterized membrane protein YraQ (UPF0718 family)